MLDLELVKPEAVPRSKTAFISTTGNKSGIYFSKYLSRAIGMVDGQNIAFYAKEGVEELKYVWGFYLTDNTLHTEPIRRNRASDMFRVNAKRVSGLIQSIFKIGNQKTVRLYVDIKSPIVYKHNGEDVKVYMIYDIPPMRDDMEDEERNEYNLDYITKMSIVKNYGIGAD